MAGENKPSGVPADSGLNDPAILKVLSELKAGGGGSASKSKGDVYLGGDMDDPQYGDLSPNWFAGGKKPKKDRVAPVEQAQDDFFAMTEAEVRNFQERLIAGGIVKRNQITLGFHDPVTEEAFTDLYVTSAKFYRVGTKRTPLEILDQKSSANKAAGLAGDEGDLTMLDNPQDLESLVQATARSRLGRKLKTKEAQRFIALYQDIQRANATMSARADEQLAAGVDATGTRVVSPGVAADQFIDSDYAQEAAGQDARGYLDVIKQIVGG